MNVSLLNEKQDRQSHRRGEVRDTKQEKHLRTARDQDANYADEMSFPKNPFSKSSPLSRCQVFGNRRLSLKTIPSGCLQIHRKMVAQRRRCEAFLQRMSILSWKVLPN